MDTTVLVTAVIASIAGNVPALIILYWCVQERKERIEERERQYRLLLALAGYETDPDNTKVIRTPPDKRAHRPDSGA